MRGMRRSGWRRQDTTGRGANSSEPRRAHGRSDRPGSGVIARIGLITLVFALGLTGCTYHDDDDCWRPDGIPPGEPRGFYSVTGDREVYLNWYPNTEPDLDGYRIYRSTEPDGYFPRIATVGPAATGFVDRNVQNGVTYYYALAAFDRSGNESALAPEDVFDTPRPEGFNLRIENAALRPGGSGYDFSARRIVDYRELEADIYFWADEDAGPWMIATERSADSYTDIQDAGFVSLDQVDWAPRDGWSPFGEVPLIEGHSYVVWTWDNHFAKFRVVEVSLDRVLIDWAYQIAWGNQELSLPAPDAPAHPAGGGNRIHQRGMERRDRS